jgi:hypothetical protein
MGNSLSDSKRKRKMLHDERSEVTASSSESAENNMSGVTGSPSATTTRLSPDSLVERLADSVFLDNPSKTSALMSDIRELIVETHCDIAPFQTLSSRKALWALAHQLTTADACGAYGEVVRKLSGDTFTGKKLFLTSESRDALAAVAMHAATPEAAEHVAAAIAAMVADNDEQRCLFGTKNVRSAIVALTNVAQGNPLALKACLLALKAITINNDNEALFGKDDVYEVMLSSAACCSRTNEMAELYGNTLRNLTVNEQNKILFNTTAMADAVARVGFGCSSPSSVRMVCGAMSTLSTKDRKPLGTVAVREALLHMAKFAQSQIAIRFWANALANITVDDDNEKLFATPQIRDAVVTLANKAVEPITIQWVATALRNISACVDHKPLVGTTDVRDALVCLLQRCSGPDSVRLVCNAMHNVTEDTANKILYGTSVVRETLVAAGAYAYTVDAARLLLGAIASIIINDDNELLFGTPSMRDLFVRLAPVCSSHADSLQRWCLALRNFTMNVDNKKVTGTVPLRDALMEIMRGAKTLADVIAVCKPLAQITAGVPENRKMFRNTNVRDTLLRLTSHFAGSQFQSSSSALQADAIRCFCNSISNITIDDDNEVLYASSEALRLTFTEVIIPAIPPGDQSACVTAVGQALRNLCAAPQNKVLFSTDIVRDAFCTLAGKVTDASSCQFVSAWLEKLSGRRESRKLFCTLDCRAQIIKMGQSASTALAVSTYCNALAQLSFDDEFEKLYAASPLLRDTLVEISLSATSADAALRLSHAISNLTAGVDNRALFCTQPIVQVLERVGVYIATAEGARMFAGALYHLTLSPETRDLFVTASLCQTMMRLAPLATTCDAARVWALAVVTSASCDLGKVIYGSSAARDAIILLSQRATAAVEIHAFARAVSAIAKNDDSERTFATAEMRDAIVVHWIPKANTLEIVSSIAIALRNLVCAKLHKPVFGTIEMRDALASMLQVAGSDAECVDNICNVIRSLCEIQENIELFRGHQGLLGHIVELQREVAHADPKLQPAAAAASATLAIVHGMLAGQNTAETIAPVL